MDLRRGRKVSAKVQEAEQPPAPQPKRKAPAKRHGSRKQKLPARTRPPKKPVSDQLVGGVVEDAAVQNKDRALPSFLQQLRDEEEEIVRDMADLAQGRSKSSSPEGRLPVQPSSVRFGGASSKKPPPANLSPSRRPGILRSSSMPGPSQRPDKGKGRALTSSPPAAEDTSKPEINVMLQVKINKQIVYSQRYSLWTVHPNDLHDKITHQHWIYQEARRKEGKRLQIKDVYNPMTVITATGLKQPIHQVWSDEADLELIRADVLRLYRANKTREIQVVVTANASFVIVGEVTPEPAPAAAIEIGWEQTSAFSDHATSVRARSQSRQPAPASTLQHRPQKESATQRMRRQQNTQQMIATATGDAAMDIGMRWQCKDRTCFNHGHCCFPTKQMGHLLVTSLDITIWNEAIRAGRTTIDQPPAEVVAGIIARRSKAKAKRGQGSPVKATSTAGNTYIISGASPGLPGMPGFAPHFWGGQDSQRSSPPALDGSEVDNLKEYFSWLIRKNHLQVELAQRVRSELLSNGWGFQQLKDVTEQDWKEMAVPRGAVVVLRQKQKLWIQWKTRRTIAEAVQEGMADLSDLGEVEVVGAVE